MNQQSRAHRAVHNAIADGTLTRPSHCSLPDCTTFHGIEAHHESYDQPLTVTWLCRHHHRLRHNALRLELDGPSEMFRRVTASRRSGRTRRALAAYRRTV